jgi:hypothetical protein
MAKKNSLPRALLKNKKISYWKVRDGASNSTYEFFVKSRDKINKLVGKLVKEIC